MRIICFIEQMMVYMSMAFAIPALFLRMADGPQDVYLSLAVLSLAAAGASEVLSLVRRARIKNAMNAKKVLCVDMDGTLCQWHDEIPFDFLSNPENKYFLHLDENENLLEAIKEIRKEGYPIVILSAVLGDWAADQKRSWLDSHGLSDVPAIFLPYGTEKSVYVKNGVLLDDFSQNLHAWENAGYVGIKFYNGVNGNHKTWHGESVRESMPPKEIYRRLLEIMQKEGNW